MWHCVEVQCGTVWRCCVVYKSGAIYRCYTSRAAISAHQLLTACFRRLDGCVYSKPSLGDTNPLSSPLSSITFIMLLAALSTRLALDMAQRAGQRVGQINDLFVEYLELLILDTSKNLQMTASRPF